jgi:hypothetical protein
VDSAEWLTYLPKTFTRRRLVGLFLMHTPSLQALETFQKESESGRFKPVAKP